ncbi:MAG: hypothetical protein GZ094_17265 [Mariniphaga sp.]|nr:hypothetical protein [Mariniphaga sp.]
MKTIPALIIAILSISMSAFGQKPADLIPIQDTILIGDSIQYHPIRISKADNSLLPWYSPDPGKSYDFVINATWNFWDTMRTDLNGLPYYMNHQVWKAEVNDTRGVAGSQFEMALSSWRLLYQYSGNDRIRENMKFMADYYISHSLSPSTAAWPNLPYPYNTLAYSGIYDGDMVIGRDYTQPDKAGSFGNELINLYKFIGTGSHGQTPTGIYLETAIKIANTLAKHTISGNDTVSPLPFKVNAMVGKFGKTMDTEGIEKEVQLFDYTTNWSGTMELFLGLIQLKKGNTTEYQKAIDTILAWMKKYPLQNNHWGPFFEDIVGQSETQINAITFAQFMMNHPEYFPNWKTEVKGIFSWVYEKLGNKEWQKYGVIVVNEQTAFKVPGNSHTSRQASAELQYAELTGEQAFVKNAILQLNWATYMVDFDGKNRYMHDDIWLSDGYGDYVRHYLRSMASKPELAPPDQNHLLSSTSVIQLMEYPPTRNKKFSSMVPSDKLKNTLINYRTFDDKSTEIFRMTGKPSEVLVNQKPILENEQVNFEGWMWKSYEKGGVLTIRHLKGNKISVNGN